ncbi:hypothetical protein QQ008_03135 [Fulvivirgaceae bacterium BMA10]|uniref:ABM domain-containing protein n=1 Tax=Splendidivirga corallicola TaxID=3051826 RepID=A0ABT8KHZ3_9BACT|nr:hypothetical protein [Fulvivirgaceae bacterium BMA10]
MKKSILALSAIVIAFQLCLGKSVNQFKCETHMKNLKSKKIYEMALFEITDEALSQFKALNQKTISALSGFKGYLNSHTYQSVSDPNLVLDVVAWETLEDAKRAAEIFEYDERFTDYKKAIKTIKYFDHVVEIDDNPQFQFRAVRDSDIFEFATINLDDQRKNGFSDSREPLFNYLGKTYDGFKQVTTYRSMSKAEVRIDFGVWENETVCERAQKELESHELLLNFMQHMDMKKEMIMAFFKRIR